MYIFICTFINKIFVFAEILFGKGLFYDQFLSNIGLEYLMIYIYICNLVFQSQLQGNIVSPGVKTEYKYSK